MSIYPCPCCGFLTLGPPSPGSYEICPVCWWEDDLVQYKDPSREGGANRVSLNQARRNFREFGASEREFIDQARPPRDEEKP